MMIYGIDFTSRPSRRKPITCLSATLEDKLLRVDDIEECQDFEAFERMLRRPGLWIAGADFPFGQSRKFIESIGWPSTWAGYVTHVGSMKRSEFCRVLSSYASGRQIGDKEHKRACDRATNALSPQKLFGVPVAKMFFEGAPRLIEAGVTIPHLHQGDPRRIVVEAYPGVLARAVIGRRSYKSDAKSKQTGEQHEARHQLFLALHKGATRDRYGFDIDAPDALCVDPSGDSLDALLCAIQAAWAWLNKEAGFGASMPFGTGAAALLQQLAG